MLLFQIFLFCQLYKVSQTLTKHVNQYIFESTVLWKQASFSWHTRTHARTRARMHTHTHTKRSRHQHPNNTWVQMCKLPQTQPVPFTPCRNTSTSSHHHKHIKTNIKMNLSFLTLGWARLGKATLGSIWEEIEAGERDKRKEWHIRNLIWMCEHTTEQKRLPRLSAKRVSDTGTHISVTEPPGPTERNSKCQPVKGISLDL